MSKAWEIKPEPKLPESPGKKLLEIELFEYGGTLLVGRILHQDESLRGKGTIYDRDYFVVKSTSNPAFEESSLYIRGGSREFDDSPMYLQFNTQETLKNYVCNVKKALHEINKRAIPETKDETSFKRLL